MNDYEITYIANPKIGEDAKNKLDEAIDATIIKLKGEITNSHPATGSPASRRKLQYPVEDHLMTWLRVVQIKLDPKNLVKLRTAVDKTKEVIRTTIIQTPYREETSNDLFDTLADQNKPTKEVPTATKKKASKPVSDKEVEDSIEAALNEEIK